MPALALQQQSAWENNVYVLTITRIFVIVGVTYLFRSLYQWARPVVERFPLANLIPWAIAAAPANVDLSLDDLEPDNPSTLTVDADLSNTASVRPPQPSYDPRRRPQSAPARPHPSPQSHQCSIPSDMLTPTSSRIVASNDASGSGGNALGTSDTDNQSV